MHNISTIPTIGAIPACLPSLDCFTSEDAQDQVARMPRQKGAHLITQLFNSSSLGEWYSHVAPFLMSFPT